jgi:NADH-quinone oxidoreductase subunit N
VQLPVETALFYLTSYALATLVLFIAIGQTSVAINTRDDDLWRNWQGLFWQNKLLALAIIVALLSLAGIPLTAGFIAKFYLLHVLVDDNSWHLLSALIVGSGLGLFYYLRIVFVLFTQPKASEPALGRRREISLLSLLTLLLLFIGIMPADMAKGIVVLAAELSLTLGY